MPLESFLVSGDGRVWGREQCCDTILSFPLQKFFMLPDMMVLGLQSHLHFLAVGIVTAYDTSSFSLKWKAIHALCR